MAPRTNGTDPEREPGTPPLPPPAPEPSPTATTTPTPVPGPRTSDIPEDGSAQETEQAGEAGPTAEGEPAGEGEGAGDPAEPHAADAEGATDAGGPAEEKPSRLGGLAGAESETTGARAEFETPADPAEPENPGARAASENRAAPDGDTAPDPRVVAVRRVGEAGRRLRALQVGGTVVLLAVALTFGSVAVGALRDRGATTAAAAPSAASPALLTGGSLDASIAALQAQLKTQPKDFGSWATLGLAYVEQARTKGDPSRYPQAAKALKRSLDLRPGNEQAVTGQAALAAARHDFTHALTYADSVLKENPYSERALSSRIDALVELGRYAEASKAADTADSRRPGVPVFTRYAYVHELRGDVRTARQVLQQALATSTARGDISYVAAQLGQLAWNQGDYKSALTYYARALAADENYLPALEGRARAQYASGDHAAAIKGMEQVVARYPLPQPLVELGEMYEDRGAKGDDAKAHDQYALVDAWIALARSYGVNADLDTALAAADHGSRTAALRAARAEWARRHTVHTADALAWALHVNGEDAEALPYARQATATGYRNAAFLYHRGMIERATGHAKDARTSLTAALRLNPGFSPLGAREARKAIKDLEAAR